MFYNITIFINDLLVSDYMDQVTEEHIEQTVKLLEFAVDYQLPSGIEFLCGACKSNPNLPSVKSAFDAFIFLPGNHPLKTKFDLSKVTVGYNRLGELDFDPNNNYEELDNRLTYP